MRKQLSDITIEPDSNLRMKYRGQIIMRLLPAKVEQKVQSEVVTYDVEGLLDRMLEKDKDKKKVKDKENEILEENR